MGAEAPAGRYGRDRAVSHTVVTAPGLAGLEDAQLGICCSKYLDAPVLGRGGWESRSNACSLAALTLNNTASPSREFSYVVGTTLEKYCQQWVVLWFWKNPM